MPKGNNAAQNNRANQMNPNNAAYKRYGARGITVCGEWREFFPFERWAFMSGYQDTLTLDRVDGARGYEPNNSKSP